MAHGEPRPLERVPGRALWMQLEADLRDRVDRGEFDQGFPSEWDLVRQYCVSRHTVREALRRMRESGVVDTSKGRTSSVGRPILEQPLGSIDLLFRAVEASGVEQRSTVRALEVRRDPAIASMLAASPDEDLVFIERLRLAGEEPLALDRSWLPSDVGGALLDGRFERTTLYAELKRLTGIELTGGVDQVHAVTPDPATRRVLRVPAGVALLVVTRVGCFRGRPVELRESLIRGDRFGLTAAWPGDAGYRLTGTDPVC